MARVSVLQVTDALGPYVRVRALVSSADAPTDWDLRCLVRERLVTWLQLTHPGAVPHARTTLNTERLTDRTDARVPTDSRRGTHVFSGSVDGDERAAAFAPRTDPP